MRPRSTSRVRTPMAGAVSQTGLAVCWTVASQTGGAAVAAGRHRDGRRLGGPPDRSDRRAAGHQQPGRAGPGGQQPGAQHRGRQQACWRPRPRDGRAARLPVAVWRLSAGLRPRPSSADLRPGPLSAGLRPGPSAGPRPTTRHPQPDRRGQDLSPRRLRRRGGRSQGDGRRALLDDGGALLDGGRALLDGGRRRSRVIGDDRGHRRAGGHHGSRAFWLPDRIPPGGIPGRIPPVILPARDRSLPLRRPALGRHGAAGSAGRGGRSGSCCFPSPGPVWDSEQQSTWARGLSTEIIGCIPCTTVRSGPVRAGANRDVLHGTDRGPRTVRSAVPGRARQRGSYHRAPGRDLKDQ